MSILDEPMLTTRQVAELTGIGISTLEQWRHKNVGPTYIKCESKVLYPRADLEAYLEAGRHEPREHAA